MIGIVKWQAGTPDIDLKETLRYMGVRTEITPELTELAESGIKRVQTSSVCRGCYLRVPVEILSENELTIAGEALTSRHLARHLKNCKEAFLMAATVGPQIDRLIQATARLSQADSLAIDAAGSAAVEWVCDELNAHLNSLALSEEKALRWRFSPGYGDVPLSYQTRMAELLNLTGNLGITLSPSLMMFPTKSVTAIVGICEKE